jgi:thioredoxin 1
MLSSDDGMSGEHEQFISEGDEELKRIREKRLKKLTELEERRQEMSPQPLHVTDANFQEIVNKHLMAFIDFWAPWCGPCLALAPTVEELAQEYSGKIFVGKLNVDDNPKTAECFQVFSIPTMVIFKDGREVERIVGLVPRNRIEAALRKHME